MTRENIGYPPKADNIPNKQFPLLNEIPVKQAKVIKKSLKEIEPEQGVTGVESLWRRIKR